MSNSPYTVGGTILPNQGIYIERQADSELLATCREMEYAYLLTARQLGKSSLMVRTAGALQREGVRPIILDLNELGVQATMQEWYLGLMFRIASYLGIQANLLNWWRKHEDVGVTQRLTLFFSDLVLSATDQPIIVFIDEIDTTLSLPFTDDFFAAIRYLYNARSTHDDLKRLAFVLIGVATPSDLIDDPKRTPFNIGRRIDLTDFTRAEADPFTAALPDNPHKLLDQIIDWTGGHPYLTQRLAAAISASDPPNVNATVRDIFLGENSGKDNNLQFVRDMLTKRAPTGYERDVLTTYQRIRLSRQRVRDEEQSVVKNHLKLTGIVKRNAKGDLTARNKIYDSVFDRRWLRNQWPESWFELIPPAVKTAVVVSFVLLLGLVAALGFGLNQQRTAAGLANDLATEVVVRASAENQSATRAAEAIANADLAATSAADAEANAQARATSEAVAVANADLAATRAVEAENANRLAQARALASQSRLATQTDPQAGLALARESVALADTVEGRLAVQVAQTRAGRSVGTVAVGEFLRGFSDQLWDRAGERLISADSDANTITLWNGATGDVIWSAEHPLPLSVWWSPDDMKIASVGLQGATIRDAMTGDALLDMPLDGANVAAWSNDGTRLAVADFDDQRVLIFDALTGETLHALALNQFALRLQWRSDDAQLLVLEESAPSLWDTDTGELVAALPYQIEIPPVAFTWSAEYSPDGTRLLVNQVDFGTGIRNVTIWDGTTGDLLHSLESRSQLPNAGFEFVPTFFAAWRDDATIITINVNQTLTIWNALSGEPIESQTVPIITNAIMRGDDLLFYIAGELNEAGDGVSGNGEFVLWDVATGGERLHLTVDGAVVVVAFSADNSRLATFDAVGNMTLWDLANSVPLGAKLFPNSVDTIAVAPNGTDYLTEADTGQARLVVGETVYDVTLDGLLLTTLWRADGAELLLSDGSATLSLFNLAGAVQTIDVPSRVRSAYYTDEWIVVNAENGRVYLYDSTTHALVHDIASDALFSKFTGGKLITSGADGTVRVWEVGEDVAQIIEIERPAPSILSFVADGFMLIEHEVLGESSDYSADTTITRWSFEQPQQPTSVQTLNGWQIGLVRDGHLLTYTPPLALEDGAGSTLAMWDATTLEPIFSADLPAGVWEASWGPSGEMVAVAVVDGLVRVFSADGELLTTLPLLNTAITAFDWANENEIVVGSADGRVVRLTLDVLQ